nr:hypothetical protein [Ketobacter sp.]
MPFHSPKKKITEFQCMAAALVVSAASMGISTSMAFKPSRRCTKAAYQQARSSAIKERLQKGNEQRANQGIASDTYASPLLPESPCIDGINCILYPSIAGKWHWVVGLPPLLSRSFNIIEEADADLTYLLECIHELGLFKGYPVSRSISSKHMYGENTNALGFATTHPPLPPAPALPDPVHHTADAASSDTLACLLCPACGASLSVYVDPTHGSS